MLNVKVLKTIMSGETLDIIQFCGIFFKRADHVHR